MKRKFLCLLLALTMVLGLAANVSAAEEIITSGDWSYRVYGDEAVLCTYNGTATEVTVPATIDGLRVTELGWGLGSCFSAVSDTMTSVTIEDGIPLINNAAFKNCTALTDVSIPASVTTIGFSAFEGCTSLSEVIFNEGLKSIGRYAFLNTNLSYVILPASVTSIDEDSLGYTGEWGDTKQIESFGIFGYSNTAAEEYAWDWHFSFYRLEDMTDTSGRCGDNTFWRFEQSTGTLYITCDETMEGWGDTDPYYNSIQPWIAYADSIRRVVVEEGVRNLGDGFMNDNYPNLTEVILPSTLSSIENFCFWNCTGLISINLPENCLHFGGRAFQNTGLRSITLSNTRDIYNTLMAGYAFAYCPDLENVYFTGNAWDIDEEAFLGSTLTAWYPSGNATWTEEVRQNYGGKITWNAYDPELFMDIPVNSFYYAPVKWARDNKITAGVSDTLFGSADKCNRAQAVTFLWAAAGKPEPTVTEHPFVDVPKGSFCEKAVLWAVEKGITSGTDATHFNPTGVCNRATIVTFLYKALGSPEITTAENPFEDIPAESWYTIPVLWALENGITSGTDATHFTPGATCIRAQMVTFLYSAYNK
ncbi:MAG: leucine-rich repeat protein [Oscillospiraceae bacterium]|nr:leucine-rich repeat protein [Oscillospiraceae bacterium]